MRRTWIGIFVLLGAVAQTPAGLWTQYPKTHKAPPGNIEGRVVNAKGAPVPGARILWQPADGEKPHVLQADAQGNFHIAQLRTGLYELRASATGMTSEWSHNVLVRPAAESTLTLILKPAAPSKAKPVSAPVHQQSQ